VVGLLGFEPTDIDHSISVLLDGLKTAFITSLGGMGLSVLFKILSTVPGFSVANSAGSPLQPLLQALRDLRAAVAGEEESSLAGQLKLLRTDLRDAREQSNRFQEHQLRLLEALDTRTREQTDAFATFTETLWQRLETFAEMLSRSATEQVIEALRQVIVDFNRNLTEQFGDNFKALDASVQRLVQWQAEYRTQLEQMRDQYTHGVESITRTEVAVSQIREHTDTIPQTMASLRTVIETNQHQIDELGRHLEAFGELRDRAVAAVPEIHDHIQKITAEIQASVDTATQHQHTLLEQTQRLIGAHDQAARQLIDEFKAQTLEAAMELHSVLEQAAGELSTSADNLQTHSQQIGQHLTEAAEAIVQHTQTIQTQLQETTETLRQSLLAAVDQTLQTMARDIQKATSGLEQTLRQALTDSVNEQLQLIDQSMQKEIERVMNQMGTALATISETFTTDYQRLVQAMDNVVRSGVRQ
jgi:chromosome segregation ATPase